MVVPIFGYKLFVQLENNHLELRWKHLSRILRETGAICKKVIEVAPEIVSHNLETVRRLTKEVRIQAKYDRSLELLFRLKKGGMKTKSGMMLGIGETHEEIIESMEDLRSVQVDVLTLGQYLQPTPKHLPVVEFVTPERFKEYEELGLKMGFRFVESGPLVRSSYHAEKHVF